LESIRIDVSCYPARALSALRADRLSGTARSRCLAEQKIELVVSDEVKDLLLREGFDEEYGARPLRRAIQTFVDDALADAFMAGTITSGQMARLVVQDGRVVVEELELAKAA